MMKYNEVLIDFFKKHNIYDEEMFHYFENNTDMINYNNEEERMFIGCTRYINKKGRLENIVLGLPYLENDLTAIISIHELTHAIEAYKKLGKKFNRDITIETLPFLYEKLYVIESSNQELMSYLEYLDSFCTEEYPEYKFALDVREELIEKYNYNFKESKKLIKKRKRKL